MLRRKGLHFLQPLFESWKTWGRADGQKKIHLELELKQKLKALADLKFDAKIRILAEWDSVSAIGLPLGLWREKFSFVNDVVPECVQHALFAMALDERRRSFKPRQWATTADKETTLSQCAFVGCHSDIGGGNPDVSLSTVSLIWMISKIREYSKAAFDDEVLLQFIFPFQPTRFRLGWKHISWRTPQMELKNFGGTKGGYSISLGYSTICLLSFKRRFRSRSVGGGVSLGLCPRVCGTESATAFCTRAQIHSSWKFTSPWHLSVRRLIVDFLRGTDTLLSLRVG